RARFVDVVFGPDEAYGAPNSLLWLIPGFLQNPLDDVYNERKKICDSISDLPVSKTECEHASMGHPNPKGARRYADSIIRVLQQFVPEWKARRGSIASSAPGSPLYIEIAYAPRTATGAGIMTVHAADWSTGIAVPAMVQLDNRMAGSTGDPITYQFDQKPTTIQGTVIAANYPLIKFQIHPPRLGISVKRDSPITAIHQTRALTVTAFDAEQDLPISETATINIATNRPVNGTVTINDVTGQTGKMITY